MVTVLRTPDAGSTSSDAPHAEQNLASSGFARPHDTQVTTCEGCRYETCRCKTRVRLPGAGPDTTTATTRSTGASG